MTSSGISGFKLDYRISNHSNKDLIVKTRGGMNYVVRKSRNFISPGGARRIVFIKMVGVHLSSFWFNEDLCRNEMDKLIVSQVKGEIERRGKQVSLISSEFQQEISMQIDLTDSLADVNGAIQSEILGLNLYPSADQADLEPSGSPEFSLGELLESAKELQEERADKALYYFSYLNDPKNVLEPLYVNLMGKPSELPISKDPDTPGGLYIGLAVGNSPPDLLYYSFDRLTKEMLFSLGIFKTMEECSQTAGNTDRVITAENKLKERGKEVNTLQSENKVLKESLTKSDSSVAKLAEELMQVKAEHRHEIQQLKNDHRLESMKNQMGQELQKAQGAIKETVSRANMELDRKRSTANNWGEIAKAVAAIATIVVTGYKLYSS